MPQWLLPWGLQRHRCGLSGTPDYGVGFAPGGITDVLARIVAQKLSESWGQPVIAPAATVRKIWTEVKRLIRSPEISKRLTGQGVDPLGGTPEASGKLRMGSGLVFCLPSKIP